MSVPDIVTVSSAPIAPTELRALVERFFDDMVDVRRAVIAIGGELHADAEALLLEQGSHQEHLWGANYPGRGEADCIEFTALINIRPSQGNRSMEIESQDIREQVRKLTFERRAVVSIRPGPTDPDDRE